MKGVELVAKVTDLLDHLYRFYRNSPLNRSELKRAFEALKKTPLVPTRCNGTRWVGHLQKALKQIIKGFYGYTRHLQEVSQESHRIFICLRKNKCFPRTMLAGINNTK